MPDATDTDELFRAKYLREAEAIARLTALGGKKIGAGALGNLKRLAEVASKGFDKALSRKSSTLEEQIRTLVREFMEFGAKAVLLTGAQRGGDFLNNQIRGQWAERVALSMPVAGLTFVPFGPSGAAMPGEQDHRQVVMAFKEIHLLEGKRPDLLGFDKHVWGELSASEKTAAEEWPTRRLEVADDAIVGKARCGAEVKNSTWHYGKRRAAGGGPLSITVKDEEVGEIHGWSERTNLPVVFVQVLFDEIYCMSFRRMEAAISRGHLYRPNDYELDEQTGEKVYHKFHLSDDRHLCGRVVFPSESTAEVRILDGGNVVPFINYQPARTTDIAVNVVLPWFFARAEAGRDPALPATLARWYETWPASEDNAVLRLARQRLFGGVARRMPRKP